MKKIPTLFVRTFDEKYKLTGITEEVAPGLEWVLEGKGEATIKYDGSCCAMIDGVFYRRHNTKKGKTVPDGATPCCEPNPVTGHWPHWMKIDPENSADKWFVAAKIWPGHLHNGTYEAIGEHFNNNPYGLEGDFLIPHGVIVQVPRSFEGIREWLRNNNEEGLVFWKDGEPMCKIKRTDFGFEWPIKEDE